MKKLYFLCLTLLITTLSFGQTTDLLISKYAEGSGDNKFLEIYNGTGADVDLSNYSISSCSNGCDTFGEFDFPDNITFASGTMLMDGDVYVIAHPSADAQILAEADTTFQFLSNGDDAYALTLAGATASTYTIIDILGDLQGDPGSGWAVGDDTNGTQNQTLTRKTSICSPNPTPLGSFGVDAATSEWNIGPIDSGWDTLGSYTGCLTNPVVTITSPTEGASLASGTTLVDIVFNGENVPAGSTFDITVALNGGSPNTINDVTSPVQIPTVDGDNLTVTIELVNGAVIASDTVNFSISFPCDLQIGTITETCDAINPGPGDTYNVTLDYTGGGTTIYTIYTQGIGTLGGDDPTSVAAGTITITNIPEDTDFVVTFTGDPVNSGCDFTRNINSPDCNPVLTLPLYDGFDYADASTLTSAPNWDNINGTSDEILISATSLSYAGLAPSTGNKASFDGGGIDNAIFFAPVTSGTVYSSFIFRVTDLSLVTDPDGGYFAFLGAFDGRLWVVPSAGGYQVGLGYNTGSADIINATEHALNDEVFVVMSYETTTGVMKAWINPSSADFEGTEPAETITFIDPTMAASINRFALRQDSTTETGFIDVDELRVGTSWADVTPTTLSTQEFTSDRFKVYPNPTSTGFVNITSGNNDNITVVVYNILGKQVINETLANNRLNVSELNTGIYILKISQNNASVTKKLVIK
ncbi:Por secretion system C-terminal sorting domain-containing protein [Formosa sp. Hel1_31_208]|uniref:T9SS type A sorting domain-containing protein n=1 Tax=Formosa sp. Hel1_31_208 TaxID=1798225 RepID=UPI00087CBBA2|nr:T9SS type A sorting domain-containing protein [Formosa sp. Hel1_31_208]SDR84117.1 Por secretion system C-terminal sorting domain-containing protein [Formosa sp. Hel1_31_208]